MDFSACTLKAMDERAAAEISAWEYPPPFSMYTFKGRPNGWLFNRAGWGSEQFYLAFGDKAIGQLACQWEDGQLWVGWSLHPGLCGLGEGRRFVQKCVQEIRRYTGYPGKIFLRVARSNARAVKAYQRAGFVYQETIQDEIAYTGIIEDFWVMALAGE